MPLRIRIGPHLRILRLTADTDSEVMITACGESKDRDVQRNSRTQKKVESSKEKLENTSWKTQSQRED